MMMAVAPIYSPYALLYSYIIICYMFKQQPVMSSTRTLYPSDKIVVNINTTNKEATTMLEDDLLSVMSMGAFSLRGSK